MPTVVTKTVGPSGRDYTSLSAAITGEKATRANLVSSDEQLIIECDSFEDTGGQALVHGFTTDATRFLTIRGVDAPDPNFSSGYRLRGSMAFGGIRQRQAFTRYENIAVEQLGTAASSYGVWPDLVNVAEFKNCVFKVPSASPAQCVRVQSDNIVFKNCMAFNGAFAWYLNGDNLELYNCFSSGSGADGFRAQVCNSLTVQNCVAVDFSNSNIVGFVGGTVTANTNNASDLATTTGTDGVANVSLTDGVDFVAPSTGDYTPVSGGALDSAGADLSGLFTDDITGATRTQWDIGAFAVVSAGGGGTTVSVPASSISVTGFAPTVSASADISLSIPAGSVAVSGLAPTVSVSANVDVDVPQGSLSVTGFAPSVNVSDAVEISVGAGSLTVNGLAPTVTVSDFVEVSVPTGSVSVTGLAPLVTIGNAQVVPVPAGAVNIQGYAPGISVTSNISVEIPAGTVEITTFAPNVGTDFSVTVPAGSASITGYEPTVVASVKTVICTLVDVNGNALPNLVDLSYAWFDEPDPANLTEAVVKGVTESTDGSGEIEVPVSSSTLTSGQTGLLILRSSDGVSLGAYNLAIQ